MNQTGSDKYARIVLHPGLQKTGSSFLQTVLHNNRAELKASGFIYPAHESRAFEGARLGAVSGHDQLASLFCAKASALDALTQYDKPRTDIPRSATTLILSAENLSNPSYHLQPKRIADWLLRFGKTLTVVVFSRDDEDWIWSLYKEQLSNGWSAENRPYDVYLQRSIYAKSPASNLIAKWSSLTGSNTEVQVLDYRQSQLEGGLLKSFLSAARVDTEPEALKAPVALQRVYRSVSDENASDLLKINSDYKPTPKYRRTLQKALSEDLENFSFERFKKMYAADEISDSKAELLIATIRQRAHSAHPILLAALKRVLLRQRGKRIISSLKQ